MTTTMLMAAMVMVTAVERKEFRHFSHNEHPLVLKKLPQIRPKQDHAIHGDSDGDGEGDGVNYPGLLNHLCDGCHEEISLYDDLYCYRCDECDYDLHKVCAEAPLTIQHPLHQLHSLQLGNVFHCFADCCQRYWTGFYYYCYSCNFVVDVICATAGERKVYNPHHNHLLSLSRKRLSAQCTACGIKSEATFYQCTICLVFWLHEDCALLPKQILIQQTNRGKDKYHHDHPLTMSHGLIQRHAQHSPSCRICKVEINRNLWIYSCEKCRYFVHINCTMWPHLEDDSLSDRVLSPRVGDGSLVLELPLGDEFQSIMELLLLNYDFAKNNEDANYTALVHDHPLILFNHQDSERDDKNIEQATQVSILLHNPMKRIKLLCNACARPIAETPFYRCGEQQCNDFFLHKRCAELPNELSHRLFHEQHTLLLLPNVPKFFGIYACKICNLPSNGFAYGCVECEYYIDVRCAFMAMSIKHEAHPEHVLHFRMCTMITVLEQPNTCCDGCRVRIHKWLFHCDQCEFKLCSDCAQLPTTMRLKYDRHPLQLMYLPPEDHISQYFCDVCEEEEEMDPNEWFYHCTYCDQQMHVHCSSIHFGIKCGGFLTIDRHPHRLTFAEWRTESNIPCDDCGKIISFGFRCVQCKYALRWECACRYIHHH